jgi:hypothetical protein
MAEIEKLYINEKEAAYRYGYSIQWFQRERWKGTGPSFMKINHGKVLYPVDSTDKWFKSFKLQKCDKRAKNIKDEGTVD